jgi:hypothetical protein
LEVNYQRCMKVSNTKGFTSSKTLLSFWATSDIEPNLLYFDIMGGHS